MAERQNYSNHVRWVPLFHFFVLPVLLANFFTSTFRWRVLGFSWSWLIGMLTAENNRLASAPRSSAGRTFECRR